MAKWAVMSSRAGITKYLDADAERTNTFNIFQQILRTPPCWSNIHIVSPCFAWRNHWKRLEPLALLHTSAFSHHAFCKAQRHVELKRGKLQWWRKAKCHNMNYEKWYIFGGTLNYELEFFDVAETCRDIFLLQYELWTCQLLTSSGILGTQVAQSVPGMCSKSSLAQDSSFRVCSPYISKSAHACEILRTHRGDAWNARCQLCVGRSCMRSPRMWRSSDAPDVWEVVGSARRHRP